MDYIETEKLLEKVTSGKKLEKSLASWTDLQLVLTRSSLKNKSFL